MPGAIWTQVEQVGSVPLPRKGHAISLVPGTANFILFGGICEHHEPEVTVLDNSFYVFDSSSSVWSVLDIKGTLPEARYQHAMCFYTDDKLVLFGGNAVQNEGTKLKVFGELNLIDMKEGQAMQPFTANERPSNRYGCAMASNGTEVVVLGGLEAQYCTMDAFVLKEKEIAEDAKWENQDSSAAEKRKALRKTVLIANKNVMEYNREMLELEKRHLQ